MPIRTNFKLSNQQVADARKAIILLEGSNLSLLEAAKIANRVTGGEDKDVDHRTTLDDVIDLFLTDLRKSINEGEKREDTYTYYESKLQSLSDRFPSAWITDVNERNIEDWLHSLQLSKGGKHAIWRAVRRLFKWAFKHRDGFIREDWTPRVQIEVASRAQEIGFLTVKEAALIMRKAPPPTRAGLALALFAGLRPNEIVSPNKPGLSWDNIDLKSKIIRVPGDTAKTKVARVLEDLPPNLWLWLKEYRSTGPVFTWRFDHLRRVAQDAAGFSTGKNKAVKPWPYDAMRHSFATYHVAKFSDAGKTSLLLGHESGQSLLHRHYRGLATKAEATKYFNIKP